MALSGCQPVSVRPVWTTCATVPVLRFGNFGLRCRTLLEQVEPSLIGWVAAYPLVGRSRSAADRLAPGNASMSRAPSGPMRRTWA